MEREPAKLAARLIYKDYQSGGRWTMPWASRGLGGRRARHDSRPEELRAINCVDDALAGGAVQRYQDAIIGLAMESEEKPKLTA